MSHASRLLGGKSGFFKGLLLGMIAPLIFIYLVGGSAHATSPNTFSGTLKDSNGTILSGVTITLLNSSRTILAAADTAADGTFSVSAAPGVYALTVSATNYTLGGTRQTFSLSQPTSVASIDLTSGNISQDLTIPLSIVTATVYNAQGYLMTNGNESLKIGSTASSGSSVPLWSGGPALTSNTLSVYTSSNVPASGSQSFTTIAGTVFRGTGINDGICSNGATSLCNATSFTAPDGSASINIPKAPVPANTFSGTLTDSNGAQLPGVTVSLRDNTSNSNTVSTTTGSDGTFNIAVEPGVYALTVSATDYTLGGSEQKFSLSQPVSAASIDLTSGNISQNLTIPLSTITATVYNAQGYLMTNGNESLKVGSTASSGSSVSLWAGGPTLTSNTITVYSLSNVPTSGSKTFTTIAGTVFRGSSSSDGICSNGATSLCNATSFTAPNGSAAIDIPKTPAPRNTFSGVFSDSNGTVLAGVAVSLRDNTSNSNTVSTTTGSDGTFSIAVEPGVYALTVSATSYTIEGSTQTFTLSQPTATASINLATSSIVQDLTLPLATMSATVYDAQGHLVTNGNAAFGWGSSASSGSSVSLYLGAAPATSDTVTGHASTPNVPVSGTINFTTIAGIRFHNAGYGDGIYAHVGATYESSNNGAPFTAPNGSSSIVIPRAPAPTGLTISTPVQYPVLNWQAVAGASHYRIYRDGNKVGETASLSFEDTTVVSGTYSYQVSAVDDANDEGPLSSAVGVTAAITPPTLDAPTFSANPVINGQDTTVTVNVTGNIDGLLGGEYYIGTDPGQGNATAMTYSNGKYTATVSGLAVGSYTINARVRNSAGWSSVVSASFDVVNPVFTGILTDSNGTALSGVSVSLKNTAGTTVGTTATATDGSFSITTNPGTYALVLSANNYLLGTSRQNFVISQPVATASINLTTGNVTQNLSIPLATVTATIYDSTGNLVTGGLSFSWGLKSGSGTAISLYAGGPAATASTLAVDSDPSISGSGAITFTTIAGAEFNGTGTNDGICAWLADGVECNDTPFTATSGSNTVDIPNTPAVEEG